MTGTIRRLMTNGYGFITPDDRPFESVFFHFNGLLEASCEDLRPSQRVSYELGIDPRSGREQAVVVRLLSTPSR
jgi:cold shock CspA family protein